MIPDKAVEAAARALREHNRLLPELAAMDDTPQDEFECCAREALEAAAPHLMAAAWDECAKLPSRPDLDANPYRTNV